MTHLILPKKPNQSVLGTALVAALLVATQTLAATDLATAPLQTSTATQVKPNILFILDDSGSMAWDFMPDWVNQKEGDATLNPPELIRNSGYNGTYYDPAITYTPPLKYNGDSYKSYTADWDKVPYDGFGVQQSKTGYTGNTQRNLFTPVDTKNPTYDLTKDNYRAHYYTFIPGEYCTGENLKTCSAQTSSTSTNPYPAMLRWCTTSTLTDCKASRIADKINSVTYTNYRFPGQDNSTAAEATITVSNAKKSSSVTSITVNNDELLLGPVSPGICNTTSACNSQLAAAIAESLSENGYTATANGSTVTISAPKWLGAISYTPVTSQTDATLSKLKFSGYKKGSIQVPGRNVLTSIVAGKNSYPYPGTQTKASTRSDCAGTTCTYAEEMTNYANWWAYYRTRMQMTKTASSLAFNVLDTKFRLGYMSLNNNTDSDFLNVSDITTGINGQKDKWYQKFSAAQPYDGTPLRVSLAKAGNYYAGKLSSINGVKTVDPMQYACQRNYTILSTDGYWNDSSEPTQINGSGIGDQDQSLPRPYYDGGSKSGSISNTLADVAAYYYETDIRDQDTFKNGSNNGLDVANNNVADKQQRMYTSTVGLGASGYMQYKSNYVTAQSGDYFDILKGTQTSASTFKSGVCSWQNTGACNWPTPSSGGQTTIDDLWHAAVNGRGTYYSASNPAALRTGLSNFLQSVSAATGNAAAATTSNPNTVQGDNFLFQSTFRSVEWFGELARYRLDLDTGKQIPDADWSQSGTVYSNAASKTDAIPTLDNRPYAERKIYTYSGGARIAFEWSAMSASMRNLFNMDALGSLSQMCASGPACLDATAQVNSTSAGATTGAAGINLVNFLRGDRSNEGGDITNYYRARKHVMGDIVDSQAVYIKKPMFNYADSGYSAYKSAKTDRQGMVYVGANDGMLHAFNSDSGAESWAYIPSMLLPNLYKLADKNYSANHQYYVNATPQQADVYYDGAWRTILVGGLGRGGKGFYALDVTDPTSPTVLWEFTADTGAGSDYTRDADLGYSFGTPVISKLSDGTWAVMVTSGYNNHEITNASGRGFVWVLNAKTGTVIKKIGTGEGSKTNPSGLTRLFGYSETAATNNQASTLYGGDLLGNLWRIDISGLTSGGGTAPVTKLATLSNGNNQVQPIAARVQVSKVGDKRVVFVGTGQYLGVSDIANTQVQSIYAIKDVNTAYGNPRSNTCTGTTKANCFVKQVYADNANKRTATSSVTYDVDFDSMRGWYVDLPVSGERANTDPALQLGTLVFTTNVPSDDSACSPGGTSNIIYVNYKTGLAVPGAADIGGLLASGGISALASAATLVRLPNGKVVAIVNLSNGTTVTIEIPIGANNQGTRRLSWRELITGQ